MQKMAELVTGLRDLLEILSGLENERCVALFKTAARKNEDQVNAVALRIASLENLTPTNKEVIKSQQVVELESSSAKKRKGNISPAEMYIILGTSAERLEQEMDTKAQ